MTTDQSPVRLDRDGDIAILTLSRPDAGNAIDMAFTGALKAHAQTLASQGWARAVILRAEGRLFCGGGDVGAFTNYVAQGQRAEFAAFLDALARDLHEGVEALLKLDAPLIAAVQGAAAGAGMSLALAADFTYATPKAKFVPAYPGIGFSADGGMSWFLPRILGERRALQIMLTNQMLDANAARAHGLVTEILAEEGFDAAVLAHARKIASGPRLAIGVIRRLVRTSMGSSLHDQLDAEASGMARLAVTDDVAEGLMALRDKRAPTFNN